MYEGALSVLSLPQVQNALSRALSHDAWTTHMPLSLHIVRMHALPPSHTDYHIHAAYTQTDQHSMQLQQRSCQGLAGPWYARRERVAVKAKIQWLNGSMVQMRARAQAGQKTRGKQWIARNRRRQD